jgi:hypothetical protein
MQLRLRTLSADQIALICVTQPEISARQYAGLAQCDFMTKVGLAGNVARPDVAEIHKGAHRPISGFRPVEAFACSTGRHTSGVTLFSQIAREPLTRLIGRTLANFSRAVGLALLEIPN